MALSLKDMVKRDLAKPGIIKYQVQAIKNTNIAKISVIDTSLKDITDICLHEYKMGGLKYTILQYTLTEDDIKNKRFLMTGVLISNDATVIGSLDIMFNPINNDTDAIIGNNIEGSFNAILTNAKKEKKLISQTNAYVGDDRIIPVMMDFVVACLDDIITS